MSAYHDELALRKRIDRASPGCRVRCWRRGNKGFNCKIVLPSGAWCAAPVAKSRLKAMQNTFAAAKEPPPGFPGYVEINRRAPEIDWEKVATSLHASAHEELGLAESIEKEVGIPPALAVLALLHRQSFSIFRGVGIALRDGLR